MLIDYETALRFWSMVDRTGNNAAGCWKWHSRPVRAPTFCVTMPGRGRTIFSARRMAWYLYYGEPPPGRYVWPMCGELHCVRPKHLRSGPNGYRSDLVRGENHGLTTITEADVLDIRDRYFRHRHTQKEIAADYDLCRTTISDIVNRRTWGHVTRKRERVTANREQE